MRFWLKISICYVTVQLLWQNTPDVGLIAANEWASYLNLNPLHYYISDVLQDLVYEGRLFPFASLQDLDEAIKTGHH